MVAEALEEEREAWSPQSLEDVDWALSRIAELRRQVEENESVLRATIERAKLRTERLNEGLLRGIAYFMGQVRGYAETHREKVATGKKKSRTLLHGVVGWRSRPARLVVEDAEKLLLWAGASAEFVRVKREPDLKAIGDYFRKTGEVPLGARAESECEEFYVRTEESHDVSQGE